MSIVEGFERKALFNITRAVALVCVTVFLLVIVGSSLYGISVWREQVVTNVSPQEIVDQLKPIEPPAPTAGQPQGIQPLPSQGPGRSPLYGYRIPFSLQKYASGEAAQVISNRLDAIPATDRQQYLDELGSVVTAADAKKVDAIEAINAYMKAKSDRYAEVAAKRVEKWVTLKVIGGSVAGGLLLVALFSLVLVLLAIERNTRPVRGDSRRGSEQIANEPLTS
jgi:hypothetical protein